MTAKQFKIGDEVVRSKGDYVVGRIGDIVTIDEEKQRAQVQWHGETKTWVKFDAIELTSIPYGITESYFDEKKHRPVYQKYYRK